MDSEDIWSIILKFYHKLVVCTSDNPMDQIMNMYTQLDHAYKPLWLELHRKLSEKIVNEMLNERAFGSLGCCVNAYGGKSEPHILYMCKIPSSSFIYETAKNLSYGADNHYIMFYINPDLSLSRRIGRFFRPPCEGMLRNLLTLLIRSNTTIECVGQRPNFPFPISRAICDFGGSCLVLKSFCKFSFLGFKYRYQKKNELKEILKKIKGTSCMIRVGRPNLTHSIHCKMLEKDIHISDPNNFYEFTWDTDKWNISYPGTPTRNIDEKILIKILLNCLTFQYNNFESI